MPKEAPFRPVRQALLPYSVGARSAKVDPVDLSISDIDYPVGTARECYVSSKTGKKPTAFAWRVYDALLKVPAGHVTTYGALAEALNSHPRAIGNALRNNPFAPKVPCHRIVAANGALGGFFGEWGLKGSTNQKGTGEYPAKKLEMLKQEGVLFDHKGVLVGGKQAVYKILPA